MITVAVDNSFVPVVVEYVDSNGALETDIEIVEIDSVDSWVVTSVTDDDR